MNETRRQSAQSELGRRHPWWTLHGGWVIGLGLVAAVIALVVVLLSRLHLEWSWTPGDFPLARAVLCSVPLIVLALIWVLRRLTTSSLDRELKRMRRR